VICSDCKNGLHQKCQGGTWCNCQHKGVKMTEPDKDAVELEDEIEDDEDWEDEEEDEDEDDEQS